MPHLILEYSANLDGPLDMQAMCENLRKTAIGIDALPMPGVRVRALRADHFAIADGASDHAFIDISVRLRAGRPDSVKEEIATLIFGAARDFVAPYMSEHSLALSLEVRDIDPNFSLKISSIRDHLKEKT